MRRSSLLLALTALVVLAPNASALDRYDIAGGCYALDGVPGAERVRLQATALGKYLLYTPDRRFLARQVDGGIAADDAPSPNADWTVMQPGEGTFTFTAATGAPLSTRIAPADGCAVFPEADLNAKGRPAAAKTAYAPVGGLLEAHMHWMSFQYFGGRFHCGRPWHPYGIQYALPDCSEIEGPQGTAASFQNTLNYGNPAQPHDTRGYPFLTEWSKDNLTYEGTYWRWIERAYLGGLRLMVMGINENRVLCELQANKVESCNEMTTVRRGLKAIRELEDYVDAQAGGPGKGFFQIVTDPNQARRVINSGRMAVVLEIEISEPFDCMNLEQPTCDREQVDRQLDEVHDLGVRSMLLLNKFDNPLTGVRFDSGATGVLINNGNKVSAGSYWSARTCEGPLTDNTIFQPSPEVAAGLSSLLSSVGLAQSGAAPTYPPDPHCNTRGLTSLGKHVVGRMMDKQMIVNPDHMSQAGVDETLSMLEARDYSGVISPHGWMDPGNWPRLWKLGGLAFPGHSSARSYVEEWRQYRPKRTPYKFAWGYGADLGGLSHQPAIEGEGSIAYPFKSYDGKVAFDRQKTGERTFDYAKEGVAHYGLYADWFEDLRRIGGTEMADDMWQGAEAYLEMWERTTGIRAPDCVSPRTPRMTSRGLNGQRLGASWEQVLRLAGQPQTRGVRAWSWCVTGKRNAGAADTAVFSRGGRIDLVGSTSRERRGGRFVRVGDRTSKRGLKIRRDRRAAWVTVARGGRVVAVGVARRTLSRTKIRSGMRRVLRARGSQAPRVFEPSAASAASLGRPLAATGNRKLDQSLIALCQLQI